MYGYKACPDCGGAVAKSKMAEHVCDPERRVNHQALIARRELEYLESDLQAWLLTPKGRFQRFIAERDAA